MTIAAGFVCQDGVVLCTDSEHTIGQSKVYEPKIFEIRFSNALVYLAGAGSSHYIKAVKDSVRAAITGERENLEHIKAIVRDSVSEVYEDYLQNAQQAGDTTASVTLLMAVHVQGELEALLFRIEETGSLVRVESGYNALGTEAAESVLREQAELLYHELMSVFTVRHLGPWIISRVCKFAGYCGGSPEVACIQNPSGLAYFDNTASATPGEDYISEMLMDLPYIFEACITPSEDARDFEGALARFNARMTSSKNRRLSYLGGSHPADANGWLW